MNLSAHDLVYISKLFRADPAVTKESRPVIKRFVSANTVVTPPSDLAPQPFLIREIPARQGAAHSSTAIRVAFVGLSEMNAQPLKGVTLTDPIEAARRAVPEARRSADLVIVLAHGRAEEMIRIARDVPGIDVVIGGTGDMFTPPMRFGETLVAFTPYETRFLGEIRFYRDARGKFATRERFISLDAGVGDDQTAMKVAADVTASELQAFKANHSVLNEWLAEAQGHTSASGQQGDRGGYASSTACAQCHSAQYFKWANSRHARASDVFGLKPIDSDVSCVACHTSGFPQSGSLGQGQRPKLLNVQCEQCHGPGAQHVAKPGKGYGKVTNLSAVCTGCHTAQTSPKFDLQSYWEQIKHGK